VTRRNRQVLNEVGDNAIICSGVSVATTDLALEYLKLMKDIILGDKGATSPHGLSPRFPACERNGVDQGIHNVLVHKRLVAGIQVKRQEDGPVTNLQARMARIEGTQVFNSRDVLVPVVHQYDRYSALQKLLFKEVRTHIAILYLKT